MAEPLPEGGPEGGPGPHHDPPAEEPVSKPVNVQDAVSKPPETLQDGRTTLDGDERPEPAAGQQQSGDQNADKEELQDPKIEPVSDEELSAARSNGGYEVESDEESTEDESVTQVCPSQEMHKRQPSPMKDKGKSREKMDFTKGVADHKRLPSEILEA